MAVAQSIVGGERYAARVLRDGAAFLWRLNDAAGATVAADSGPNTSPCPVSGGVAFQQGSAFAEGSTAAVFDGGASTWLTIPAHAALQMAGHYSIEVWVKLATVTPHAGNWQMLITWPQSRGQVAFNGQGNLTSVHPLVGGAVYCADPSGPVVAGTWYHVVVTYDRANLRIYRNGVLKNTVAATAAPNFGTTDWRLGNFFSPTYELMGTLKDVAIYPLALSAETIAAHYGLRLAVPSGLAVGGAAAFRRTRAIVASGGGVRVGGAAAFRRRRVIVASGGGLRAGGGALVAVRLVVIPDSSDIDQALVQKLLADPLLRLSSPDGVFWEEAGASLAHGGRATRFVLVSLVDAADRAGFAGRMAEDALYLVKAVALAEAGADVKAAAARIDALLELGTLTMPGYRLLVMRREERIRMTEVDALDSTIRWQHRGGRYRVIAAPTAA